MELLEKQSKLANLINNFWKVNYQQVQSSPTEGSVQSCLELLSEYWDQFKVNHEKLSRIASLHQEKNDLEEIYNLVLKDFIKTKSLLYDEKSRLESLQLNSQGNYKQNNETKQQISNASLNNSDDNCSKAPLPILHVPTFSGKREEWESFRDMFQAVVHNKKNIGSVEKFYYLRSYLQGEAKSVLNGISLTDSNYEVAWDRLLARYDNKYLLITEHVNSLLNLKPLKEESARGLQSLHDKINHNRESLKTLEQPVLMWDIWLTNLAGKAMDPDSRRDWEQEIGYDDNIPSYDRLNDFLIRRIRMLSATELRNQSYLLNKPKHKETTFDLKKRNSSYGMLTTLTSQNCAICDDSHHSSRCEKFRASSLQER